MVIMELACIPKTEKETEYELIPGKERTVTIKRHNIGLQFEAELTFDEYYWVFGDRRPEKFNKAFELALYDFIRDELVEEELEDEQIENNG
jgi:hypothetical protein